MKWWPVKSVPENLAYVAIDNFNRMHCMEKFYAYSTKRTQSNKSWKRFEFREKQNFEFLSEF